MTLPGPSPGLRSRQSVLNSAEVHYFAREAMGPLYVNGMDVLASRQQFDKYLPGIAKNMAFDVAHTDIHGEQGLNVLKNMWFVPWTLISGLFMGASISSDWCSRPWNSSALFRAGDVWFGLGQSS